MIDRGAMRRRILKYILPVILLSVALTIPKFFESEVDYRDVEEKIIATGERVTNVSERLGSMEKCGQHLCQD